MGAYVKPSQRRKEVTRLHSEGGTYREIARKVGVSKETVRRDLITHGRGIPRETRRKLQAGKPTPFAGVDRSQLLR